MRFWRTLPLFQLHAEDISQSSLRFSYARFCFCFVDCQNGDFSFFLCVCIYSLEHRYQQLKANSIIVLFIIMHSLFCVFSFLIGEKAPANSQYSIEFRSKKQILDSVVPKPRRAKNSNLKARENKINKKTNFAYLFYTFLMFLNV